MFLGAQQGGILSPNLFALFLNDLCDDLASLSSGFVILNNTRIRSLLYADDLILPSESKRGLRSSLAIFFDYAQKWGLKINVGKSNILVFRNPRARHRVRSWKLGRGDEILSEASSYKYFGIWFTVTGITLEALNQRALAGNKAKFALINSLRSYYLRPKLALQLFDTLTASVLLYGSRCGVS